MDLWLSQPSPLPHFSWTNEADSCSLSWSVPVVNCTWERQRQCHLHIQAYYKRKTNQTYEIRGKHAQRLACRGAHLEAQVPCIEAELLPQRPAFDSSPPLPSFFSLPPPSLSSCHCLNKAEIKAQIIIKKDKLANSKALLGKYSFMHKLESCNTVVVVVCCCHP